MHENGVAREGSLPGGVGLGSLPGGVGPGSLPGGVAGVGPGSLPGGVGYYHCNTRVLVQEECNVHFDKLFLQ